MYCLCHSNSARHKLDEDLGELQRQIKLYSGELIPDEEQRPAQAYLNSGMVSYNRFV